MKIPISPTDRRMVYNYWKDSELKNALHAKQPEFIDDDPLSPQLYGRDLTSNNQVPAPVHMHDAGFSQSNSRFPGDLTHPLLENDQRDTHIVTGQPSHSASFDHFHPPFSDDPSANDVSEPYPTKSHPHPVHANQSEAPTPGCLLVCKWNDGHGPCDKTASNAEIVNHLSSSHLPQPGRVRIKCKCQWEGCNLPDLICRDTILRHIRQIHLGINCRRQSSIKARQPKLHQRPQPY